MTCAILCPAGDTKFRIMGALHKDERSRQIEPQFSLLDKFFMSHIIKSADVKEFDEKHLEDH